jgi:hypothetical protein
MLTMSRALIKLPEYCLDGSAQPLIAGAALWRTVIVAACAVIAAVAIAISAGGDKRSARGIAAEATDFQHLPLAGFNSTSRARDAAFAFFSPPAALSGEKINLDESR